MNRSRRNLDSTILRVGSVLAGLVFWHFLATTVINDTTFLVSPIVVVATGYEMLFVNGELYPHLFASSWIFFYGFLLAIVAGVPLGFVMALSPVVRDYVNPWMTTLYTTPRIAFAPVLLLWFGVSGGAKVSIVFLGCVFPILINSYYGMRVVNREYVELARSFRLEPRCALPQDSPSRFRSLHPRRRAPRHRARPHRRRHRRMVRRHRRFGLPDLFCRPDLEHSDPLRRRGGLCRAGDFRFRSRQTRGSLCHALENGRAGELTWPGRYLNCAT